MFRGYLHDDERYRKCFGGGWYLTGDLARHIEGAKPLSTTEFTQALIDNMKATGEQLAKEGTRWRDKLWPFGKKRTQETPDAA